MKNAWISLVAIKRSMVEEGMRKNRISMNSQHERHAVQRGGEYRPYVPAGTTRCPLRSDGFDRVVRPSQSQHTAPEQIETRLGVRLPRQGLSKQFASTAHRWNRLFRRSCGGVVQHGGAQPEALPGSYGRHQMVS